MRYINCVISIVFLLLLTSSVMAQGDYLKKGESGIEVVGSLIKDDISSGYGIQAGFSLNGIVDIGFAMTMSKMDSNSGYYKVKAKSYSTFIVFHMAKQNKYNVPVALSLLIGYNSATYTGSSEYGFSDQKYYEDQLIVGFGAYRNERLAPNLYIQPRGEIILHPSFETSPDIYPDYDFNSYSNFDRIDETGLNPSFNFGISLFAGPDKTFNSLLRIGPSIGFYKGTTTFAINVGVIIPFGSLKNENDDENDW